MAEIISPNNRHKKAGRTKRRIQYSVRIDLTPMVDLGFLLITFFIFTTTISEKNTMSLYMPKGSNDSMLVKNTVDVLDEMSINDVSHYAMSDPGRDEKNRMQQLQNHTF